MILSPCKNFFQLYPYYFTLKLFNNLLLQSTTFEVMEAMQIDLILWWFFSVVSQFRSGFEQLRGSLSPIFFNVITKNALKTYALMNIGSSWSRFCMMISLIHSLSECTWTCWIGLRPLNVPSSGLTAYQLLALMSAKFLTSFFGDW